MQTSCACRIPEIEGYINHISYKLVARFFETDFCYPHVCLQRFYFQNHVPWIQKSGPCMLPDFKNSVQNHPIVGSNIHEVGRLLCNLRAGVTIAPTLSLRYQTLEISIWGVLYSTYLCPLHIFPRTRQSSQFAFEEHASPWSAKVEAKASLGLKVLSLRLANGAPLARRSENLNPSAESNSVVYKQSPTASRMRNIIILALLGAVLASAQPSMKKIHVGASWSPSSTQFSLESILLLVWNTSHSYIISQCNSFYESFGRWLWWYPPRRYAALTKSFLDY